MSIVELKQNEISSVTGGIGLADKCAIATEYAATTMITLGFILIGVIKRTRGGAAKKVDNAAQQSLTGVVLGGIFNTTNAISLIAQFAVGAPMIYLVTKGSKKIGEWFD